MRHPTTASLVLAVAAGGTLGAYLRLAVGELVPVEPGTWPWATLTANLAGTLLLGLVAVWAPRRFSVAPHMGPLWGTGFCGALTTFSTVQVEVIALARDGHAALGATYYAVSVTLGVAVFLAATGSARRMSAGRA